MGVVGRSERDTAFPEHCVNAEVNETNVNAPRQPSRPEFPLSVVLAYVRFCRRYSMPATLSEGRLGDVSAPHLVRARDLHVPEQIRINPVLGVLFAVLGRL